jgi:hypothetical protein
MFTDLNTGLSQACNILFNNGKFHYQIRNAQLAAKAIKKTFYMYINCNNGIEYGIS